MEKVLFLLLLVISNSYIQAVHNDLSTEMHSFVRAVKDELASEVGKLINDAKDELSSEMQRLVKTVKDELTSQVNKTMNEVKDELGSEMQKSVKDVKTDAEIVMDTLDKFVSIKQHTCTNGSASSVILDKLNTIEKMLADHTPSVKCDNHASTVKPDEQTSSVSPDEQTTSIKNFDRLCFKFLELRRARLQERK